MNRFLLLVVLALPLSSASPAAAREKAPTRGEITIATQAINTLGLEILRAGFDPNSNAVLSPYSIQLALAMVYAGSDGETRSEMATALHYPEPESLVHGSFGELTKAIEALALRSSDSVNKLRRDPNGPGDPITLSIANRLYGQKGHPFRRAFLALLKDLYQAPFTEVDFIKNAADVARQINEWIATKTRQRIRNVIDPGVLDSLTRLVLVNAIYFKAPWRTIFDAGSTKPLPFEVGAQSINVPTMSKRASYGYRKHAGFVAVTIPYADPDVQFLIVLPEKGLPLRDLEKRMTSDLLVELGQAPVVPLVLFVPKFKLELPTLDLHGPLSGLGMVSAFVLNKADFRRMDSHRDLYVSATMHKAFLAIDEQGTEAAAATVIVAQLVSKTIEPPPERVHIDRPFLFAIQHRPSGTCLFLGRVTDPR